jgi:hypothetical protein|tara:strand:+ start:2442 stop:2615 length:174 start_codon:yes stop_codon:yes gene_type:complete
MGRAIHMEQEIERMVGKISIIENKLGLLEECLEELINRIDPLFEDKNEKKAKKSNKK